MTTDEKLDRILTLLEAMAAKPRAATGGAPTTLPGYGRSAGQPIAGASVDDLRWYANGCQRSLDDPAKAKWHDRERAMLAALDAEIARQSGGGKAATDAPVDSEDIPF